MALVEAEAEVEHHVGPEARVDDRVEDDLRLRCLCGEVGGREALVVVGQVGERVRDRIKLLERLVELGRQRTRLRVLRRLRWLLVFRGSPRSGNLGM